MSGRVQQRIGNHFGRYEVSGEIGRGGMSVVYRAYEPLLERPVALKLLAPELQHQPGLVAAMRREAISAARLRHPNIALVYEFGVIDDTPFLALEYVPGRSLRQILEAGPLLPARALNLLAQVADALHYAHSMGIVHRDVKPSNMLVGPADHLVLIDFGLAEALDDPARTDDGLALGTPHYLAPEQARGEPADARSDQYALAAVAYEMLTGRPPFFGRASTAIVHAHVHELPEPPSERLPVLPGAVDAVLLRGLAKTPHERYPSPLAFVDALRLALQGAAAPRRRNGWPLTLTIALLVGLVLLGLAGTLQSQQLFSFASPTSGAPLPQQVAWVYQSETVGGSAPVAIKDMLVFSSLDGRLHGLQASTGQLVWRSPNDDLHYGAPAAGRGLIFVGSDDQALQGLSPTSGGTIWRTPLIGMAARAPLVDDEQLVAITDKQYIYVLQSDNGQVIWSRPLVAEPIGVAIREGWLVVSTHQLLLALDARSGVVVWEFATAGPITTAPVIAEGQVFVGTARGVLHSVALINGQEQARFQLRGAPAATPLLDGPLLYLADLSGRLTALEYGTGRERWRVETGSALLSAPLLVEDTLFFGGAGGTLYTVDARNGQELATLVLDGSIIGAPAFANNLLYVRAGQLYALHEN
jgi:outer membrane protein assembly factor BamB